MKLTGQGQHTEYNIRLISGQNGTIRAFRPEFFTGIREGLQILDSRQVSCFPTSRGSRKRVGSA